MVGRAGEAVLGGADGVGEQAAYVAAPRGVDDPAAARPSYGRPGDDLHLIGLYVPSRDASLEKIDRKRRWLNTCTAALGTVNTARRRHRPAEALSDTAIREVAEETGIVHERLDLCGRRWWSHADLLDCRDKLLPPALPSLLGEILAGKLTPPATLYQ